MFKAVLLFALIEIALGAPRIHSIHSKLKQTANYKVVGGSFANISDFSYQVSIAENGVFSCGGFLVAPDWVVSLGVCVADLERIDQLTIRVGSNHTNDGGKVYNVSQSVLHPDFDALTLDNDIGLLQLPTSVDLSLGSAIELPEARQPVPDNSSLLLSGYGLYYWAGWGIGKLNQVTIPSINRDICRKIYYGFNNVTDNMFCAGDLETGYGACSGDGGSAIVLDGKVVGIASWQSACDIPGYPAVFTQISNYVDWINKYVKL